jgi:general secretion pathway protein D
MPLHRLILIALPVLVVASALAQERPTPAQPGQQPQQQPQQAQQPQPFLVLGPNVAPGLPTVELAPILERVGRAANKRFLADGRVGAQIYLGGTEPSDITYPVLLAILHANGLAAFEVEGRVNIIPLAEIRSSPVRMVQNDDASIPADEWVMRVLTVTNIDAGALVPVLRPLMPQWAHMSAMPPASRLIIMDRYANVRRITEIVRLLDVPAGN